MALSIAVAWQPAAIEAGSGASSKVDANVWVGSSLELTVETTPMELTPAQTWTPTGWMSSAALSALARGSEWRQSWRY